MEINVGQIKGMASGDVVIVTTGSQGEPMSVLYRIAMGTHKQIKAQEGDTVILSSKFIPGNERAITHIINRLYKKGAEVIYEKVSDIHVSGHAFQEELKLMINLTKPKYFIPIHGEFRHLIRHARLAQEVGIPEDNVLIAENGHVVTFDETGARIDGVVQAGRVLVDGKGVGDVERSILKERRFLSEDGLVIVTIVIAAQTGELVRPPDLESHGFGVGDHKRDIWDNARTLVSEVIKEWDRESENRIDVLKTGIRKVLRKYFYAVIQRRPVIFPILVEI